MKKINVNLKDRSYEIIIQKGFFTDLDKYFPQKRKYFLITNDNLEKLFPDFLSLFENRIIIKDGEEYKNFETYRFVIEELLKKKIERKDCIVAFGGGVTGDIAGFAAATVLRGVDFIQIPTTLLAQVDSSVGGKTGINTNEGKNLLGAFYQPKIVLIDTDILSFLPDKQIKTGLGEVVKYAFIEKNCSDIKEFYLFDYLSKLNDYELFEKFDEIVFKSCSLKASVVSIDEKESGLRAVLNFGHTFAHAIETITNYNKFTHGEAVAMGMKRAFQLSLNLKLIDKNYYDASIFLINKFNLLADDNLSFNKDEFIDLMKQDKKVLNSKIRLVLPVCKGEVKIFDDINEEEIKKVI